MAAVTLLAVLLSAALIYSMSAQPAGVSNDMSLSMTEHLLRLFDPRYPALPEAERLALLRQLNGLVRKAAHVFEFALFGASLQLHLRVVLPRQRTGCALPAALAAGVLYAALDEWHQSFVAGRGMMAQDVLIDACGVLCGAALVLLLTETANRLKRKCK